MRKRWIPAVLLGLIAILSWGTAQEKTKSKTEMVLERMAKRTTLQMRKDAAVRRAVAAQDPLSKPVKPASRPEPGGQPNYFGPEPNWANSPIIRKFIDSLPGLDKANNLGQMITVAVADTITFPGADYYEIAVQEFSEKLHSQLPATKLRGYVQLNKGTSGGQNTVNPASIHYLGPLIIAKKDRPVRILFRNMLPTGSGGDLFLPTDTSVMGAGMGIEGSEYTQNRATLHLHGGHTPWISDGTPHQWTVPAGEQTLYKKGVSTQYVPDMFFNSSGQIVPAGSPGATSNPGEGAMTFYYTNQQSGRLMFYHDHAYGLTRLNVYAGEAAGYLITDPVDDILMNGGSLDGQTVAAGTVPSTQIPLIIQDKTFVNPDKIAEQDPTWRWGGAGQLWFPHVYMPNQNPNDLSGANDKGRWDYGPWFWPPVTILANPPIKLSNGTVIPGIPNPSIVPEAFMDTPLVNGTAYPYLTVERKAYRFRILNACNDRFLNLQLYYADPSLNYSFRSGSPGYPGSGTEVKMVPAVPTPSFPPDWPTDGRAGGVPDPATIGPDMILIGNESGLLQAPAVLESAPVGYVYDRRNIVVLNVDRKTLFLGPAERADVIIDFSQVPAGSKLILYNDAPAAVPAFDPRIDYFTGHEDLTDFGGAPTTLPGFGPNTRTIMQIRVEGGSGAAAFSLSNLKAILPTAFAKSQPPLIVPPGNYVRIQDNSLTFTPVGASAPITMPIISKAIHELFELEYGRMNAVLGVELPLTSYFIQTTIPLAYIDPPTEMISNGETQIWKITHNGVDTHAIHFHLFDVQLINRVGWDGQITPPDPSEQGWKETLLMNPLTDTIVALRPTAPALPFDVPDSVRLNDVTNPAGSHRGFSNVNPYTGVPDITRNRVTNFGWEYVWHCHLLGHEENDMMRPIVFIVPPGAPAAPTALVDGTQALISFEAPTSTGGSPIDFYTVTANPGWLKATGSGSPILIKGLTLGKSYTFTITATNAVGTGRSVPMAKVFRKTPAASKSAGSTGAAASGERSAR